MQGTQHGGDSDQLGCLAAALSVFACPQPPWLEQGKWPHALSSRLDRVLFRTASLPLPAAWRAGPAVTALRPTCTIWAAESQLPLGDGDSPFFLFARAVTGGATGGRLELKTDSK